jgi:tripartite-type tricarboxylate transporter receptor subunit TctC
MPSIKYFTACAAAVAGLAFPANAQTYPTRSIEFLVPFNAGGGADASQRAFNKFAEPLVKQGLPIINKGGAGGATGWAEAVRAKPDGYMLTITTPPFNIIPPLVKPKQTGYTMDQFTNICVYAVVPDVLLVRKDSPFKTLKEFVDHAKANPKKIAMGNTGTLGADFMTTLLIEQATGIETSQVPFTSGALAMQAVLGGTIDAMVGSTLYAVAQADSMRTLAIASGERDKMIPDVPTFKELGFDVISERLRVLSGPAKMPAEVVSYWDNICKQVVANPEFKAEMDKLGQPAAYFGHADAEKMIKDMTATMKGIVEKNKLAE